MSAAQAGGGSLGHLTQPLLSFPRVEATGRDGNMRVFCTQAELGGAQRQVPSLQGCKTPRDLL